MACLRRTQQTVERLQRARRILLRGGIVLTLDRQIGDFASGEFQGLMAPLPLLY
jgi:hypothetical protein